MLYTLFFQYPEFLQVLAQAARKVPCRAKRSSVPLAGVWEQGFSFIRSKLKKGVLCFSLLEALRAIRAVIISSYR